MKHGRFFGAIMAAHAIQASFSASLDTDTKQAKLPLMVGGSSDL